MAARGGRGGGRGSLTGHARITGVHRRLERPLVSQRPRSRCRAEGLPRLLRATCGGSLARSAYPRKTPGERKRCWPARDVRRGSNAPDHLLMFTNFGKFIATINVTERQFICGTNRFPRELYLAPHARNAGREGARDR